MVFSEHHQILLYKYNDFYNLAYILAIPQERINPKKKTYQALKVELIRMAREIIPVIDNTPDETIAIRNQPSITPSTLRQMLKDHYGLEAIDEKPLTNMEVGFFNGLDRKTTYEVIAKLISILKKHYQSYLPEISPRVACLNI